MNTIYLETTQEYLMEKYNIDQVVTNNGLEYFGNEKDLRHFFNELDNII